MHPEISIQMNVISRIALFDETTGQQQTLLQEINRRNIPNNTTIQTVSLPHLSLVAQ